MKTTEQDAEKAALAWLADLGYAVAYGPDISPNSKKPERENYRDVVLSARLHAALRRLNPKANQETLRAAAQKIIGDETPALIEENRRIHRILTDGAEVEVAGKDGAVDGKLVRLLDFDNPQNNEWLAVNQFAVAAANGKVRRADIVVFINGLPLAVMELKNPADEYADLEGAFNQLQTYKNEIPELFRANAALVVSDGINARVGALTAGFDRFMPWPETARRAAPPLQTLLAGVFAPNRLPRIIRDFTVFAAADKGVNKIIAAHHQFRAANRALEKTVRAAAVSGKRKAGIIWHTQGAGKSLLMAFYAGKLIRHPAMQNPTIVVVADQNDLDDNLFDTFCACRDLIRQKPRQAQSRAHLRRLLSRNAGGVIFTTIQKFAPEDEAAEPLIQRRNVVVIADEAHRSQYGLGAAIRRSDGKKRYGFAKYMRDSLPNASFIAFTATPIELKDRSTPAVFGACIDSYDISDSVKDGVTVPIYYESRLARIKLSDQAKTKIDAEIAALTEAETPDEQERLKQKWTTIEALVGARPRLRRIAKDIVTHFEARLQALGGKAMIVCMSRRICAALFDEIAHLRPQWQSGGEIAAVMTGGPDDPPEWQKHIGDKAHRKRLRTKMKNPADPLKIALVCDMWIVGFDAPCLHTMYLDKPMRDHGLMQAVARVNRVFGDKPGGLVVDYIGVAQNLQSALRGYSSADRRKIGIDAAEVERALTEKLEIVREMFHGFDYRRGIQAANSQTRLAEMAAAAEWILARQKREAKNTADKDAKKRTLRRFDDAVLALSQAFALAAAGDYAAAVRDEVGFFQAVRAALAKEPNDAPTLRAGRELAVRQIINNAVVSGGIVDIFKLAGIKTANIAVLSDQFLAGIKGTRTQNLALEALRRLLGDQIRARHRVNVMEARAFSQRLEDAIARYHTQAISTAEVLQQLIDLAKDIRSAHRRGEEQGLSAEEIAFYDALADNKSAVEAMGKTSLRVIAHELLQTLRSNVSVDWARREPVRARMRVLVKRILKKYGYPPDLQNAAVKNVLAQAEAIMAEINP